MKKSNLLLVLALNLGFTFLLSAQESGSNELTIDRLLIQGNFLRITWDL